MSRKSIGAELIRKSKTPGMWDTVTEQWRGATDEEYGEWAALLQ